MVVTIFSIVSILIVTLFFLNKVRITNIPIAYFFTGIKWYMIALVVYFILSSNKYYVSGITSIFSDGLNLAVLTVISFGMILYIQQYSEEKQYLQKMEQLSNEISRMEQEASQDKLKLK